MVAGLRRPTVTAWALDQVARSQPGLIEAVIGAGDRLRREMEKAMSGDRSGFQEAQADERAAIQTATDVAAGLLADGGGKDNDSARQRIIETLRAATVDLEVADLLRKGVLGHDVSAPGFGFVGISPVEASPARKPGQAASAGEDSRGRQAQQAKVAELERELGDAIARLERANMEAERAAAHAAELKQKATEAQRDVKQAQKRLEQQRKQLR
jgi:hypothetical protein